MARRHSTDVLVVGAGPVGLMTALALVRKDVNVTIVDQEDRSAVHGYALALHSRSLTKLAELGAAEELVRAGQRIDTVAYYSAKERMAAVDLSALNVQLPFALALPQSVLEDVLRRQLKEAGVKIQFGRRLARMKVQSKTVETTIDRLDRVSGGYPIASSHRMVVGSSDLDARYVVGADGHHSLVRRQSGIQIRQSGNPVMFAVFEFLCDPEAPHEMRVQVSGEGVSGRWPLQKGRCRVSFELGDSAKFRRRRAERRLVRQVGPEVFPYLEEARLAELIQKRAPWFQAPIGQVLWSIGVRFERRLASSLGEGRVWIAGDAAHIMPPLGMHSMNLGLIEAVQLAGAIAESLQAGEPREALGRYERKRLNEARQLHRPERSFEARANADLWVQTNLPSIVSTLPATDSDLTALLDQLNCERLPTQMGDIA
ncbi:MAG: FAD-dependent monooxygenase [bacterium]|nr:FAD-dependent monooxygenase [bacterium]